MSEPVTLEMVRKAQLRRNDVVKLLNAADISTLLSGCFVRVLLEIENRGEDYRVGRVVSVDNGQAYSGFTHDASASTVLYLHLQLQGQLTGINGSHYQLNSISNSPITEAEFHEWAQECPMDTESLNAAMQKVRNVATLLRTGFPQRSAEPSVASSSPSSAAFVADAAFGLGTVSNGNHGAGAAAGGNPGLHSTQRGANGGTAVSRTNDSELELPTSDQIQRLVLEECRAERAVFPRNLAHLTGSQLRIVERELIDYLENVRDSIKSNQSTCIVCMDRLPSIITLPCKHKVLCRLCATQVNSCPVCRTTAVEMFEPVEL